jgi:hypothetical protein
MSYQAEKSVADNMKALNYEPADKAAWAKLSEKEQRQVLLRKGNEREMVAAKGVIKKFQETDAYKALPANVQAAIVRVCGKTGGGGGGARRNPFVETITALFPKVGASVSELDIFKKTKMGRGEFRKRVREALKSAEADARMWIEFNEEKESWTLIGQGANQPKGWLGKPIEEPKAS